MKPGTLSKLALGGLFAVGVGALAPSAHANIIWPPQNAPVYISPGIDIFGQDASVNSGAFTLLASAAVNQNSIYASYAGNFGNYNVMLSSGLGTITGLDLTGSASVQAGNSPYPDSLVNIFVQQVGLTQPLGTFKLASAFSLSSFVSGISLSETTYIDATGASLNGVSGSSLPSTMKQLATTTFTGGSGGQSANFVNTIPDTLTGPYTITEEYTFALNSNPLTLNQSMGGSITMNQVPEPLSMSLMAVGLLGLSVVYRRRSRA